MNIRLPLFLTVYLSAACLPITAQPTISEFLAENNSNITDQDGEHSDWIEIHNPSAESINLLGWSLTDDPEQLNQWIFPEINLPANGYLIVFASGKDRRNPEEELHTNFSLSSDGEYLALVSPVDNNVVTEFDFSQQYEDISYGSSITTTTTVILAERAPAKWLVPSAPVDGWTTAEFDDAQWQDGSTGFGYDLSGDYAPYISANGNVQAQMSNLNGSLYLRIPFDISCLLYTSPSPRD